MQTEKVVSGTLLLDPPTASQKLEFGHSRKGILEKDKFVEARLEFLEISKESGEEIVNSFPHVCSLFFSFICRYFGINEDKEIMFSFVLPSIELKSDGVEEEVKNHLRLVVVNFNEITSFSDILKEFTKHQESCMSLGQAIPLAKGDLRPQDINLGIFSKEQYAKIRDVPFLDVDIACVYDSDKSQPINDRMKLVVNEDTFSDSELVKRMTPNFSVFVKSIMDDPDGAIVKSKVVCPAEYDYQVNKLNETATEQVHDMRTLKEVFEDAVKKFSGQAAVEYQSKSVTFQQLNEQANQLAHYLKQTYSVEPNQYCGISVEKSIELIVCLMTCWKLGCIYFPIEPKFPEERFRFLFEDTGCTFLLCNGHLKEKFTFLNEKDGKNVRIVDIDSEFFSKTDEEMQAYPKANPALPKEVTGLSLAYASYTSGSTGRPKAVIHDHKGSNNLYSMLFHRLKMKVGDRFMLFSSISFDEHLTTLTTLFHGSTLVICPEETRYSPPALWDFINDNKINVMKLTASVLRSLKKEKIPSVTSIAVNSEVCDVHTLTFWHSTVPAFLQQYGSQETITDHMKSWNPGDSPRNVGKLVDNFKCYILDRYLQPVPLGVPGELHVSGPTVSRGYLGRPEITKKKFLKNPFVEKDEMLYRTGDYGYLLTNGNLVFCKRLDKMVKLQGMRVELGEVEESIRKSGFCSRVYCGVKKGMEDTNILFAILIPPSEHSRSKVNDLKLEKELKDYLEKKLPYYMVPNLFIFVDEFPFTVSGKLDRVKLLNFNIKKYMKRDYIAPKTDDEVKMVKVFSDVLGIIHEMKKVGIEEQEEQEGEQDDEEEKQEKIPFGMNDDFYLRGGASLSLMILMNKVRKTFGVDINFTDFLGVREITPIKVLKMIEDIKKVQEEDVPKKIGRRKVNPAMRKLLEDFVKNEGYVVDENEGVCYRLMTEEDFDEAQKLSGIQFTDPEFGEPLTVSLKITAEEFEECMVPFMKLGIKQRASIVAVDIKTKEIVSFTCCYDQKDEESAFNLIPPKIMEKFGPLWEVVDIMDHLVPKEDFVEPVIHSLLAAGKKGVSPDIFWMCDLLNEVWAKHLGFNTFFDEPTSPVTQTNARILQQKIQPKYNPWELEYPKGSGNYPFKGIRDYCKRMIEKLGFSSSEMVWDGVFCVTRDLRGDLY